MKVVALALATFLASSNDVHAVSSSGVVNTCNLVDKPQPTGPYQPYSGDTKAARTHIIFGNIPDNEQEQILDILKKRNTTATFFTHTDAITDETLPVLKRIVADGHTVGSAGQSQIDFVSRSLYLY